jgi:uncharacterized Zn finger protein (UPF0148 family)
MLHNYTTDYNCDVCGESLIGTKLGNLWCRKCGERKTNNEYEKVV